MTGGSHSSIVEGRTRARPRGRPQTQTKARLPHMFVMEVIVRPQDRGALRLDHLHNWNYAARRAHVIEDHAHNAAERYVRTTHAGRIGLQHRRI
jgi:hypothetical protein